MIKVTNKISATLKIELKSGEVIWVPPRVRSMEIDIKSSDIVNSSCQLDIRSVRKTRRKHSQD